ncbi:hypothetical protein BGX28_006484 [Mortierella sp. GBA30]|nr:hypothetical protein BGX28_006484 [Mortierella sp. GBA30]
MFKRINTPLPTQHHATINQISNRQGTTQYQLQIPSQTSCTDGHRIQSINATTLAAKSTCRDSCLDLAVMSASGANRTMVPNRIQICMSSLTSVLPGRRLIHQWGTMLMNTSIYPSISMIKFLKQPQ